MRNGKDVFFTEASFNKFTETSLEDRLISRIGALEDRESVVRHDYKQKEMNEKLQQYDRYLGFHYTPLSCL